MYPFNPFGFPVIGLPPVFPPSRRRQVKRLDIFELPTTGVNATATTVDFGINPCVYRALPCECYVTFKVRQAVPVAGAALPVNVVTPTSSRSTVSDIPSGATGSGSQRTPIVDHKNTQVIGSDIVAPTERLAYLNKAEGIIRFVEFASGNTAAPTGGVTPTEASVKNSK